MGFVSVLSILEGFYDRTVRALVLLFRQARVSFLLMDLEAAFKETFGRLFLVTQTPVGTEILETV
jgi:hypothetical protein